MIGPNVKELVIVRMALVAIPDGAGIEAGAQFLSSKESIMNGYKEAAKWVEQAIEVVRQAAEPNPWRKSSDEEIAGEVLRQINAKKALLKKARRTDGM